MVKPGWITMSMRELNRVKVIEAVIERRLKHYQAAERLDLSTRQIHRIVDRYLQFGTAGIASKHRGKASNHQLSANIAARAITLIREHYVDFWSNAGLREAIRMS